MPKSRIRKKRIVIMRKKSLINNLVDSISICRDCGYDRAFLDFGELDEGEMKFFIKEDNQSQIDFFLYCSNCNSLSAIYKPQLSYKNHAFDIPSAAASRSVK